MTLIEARTFHPTAPVGTFDVAKAAFFDARRKQLHPEPGTQTHVCARTMTVATLET